ncbi:MAG: NAD(P)-dependent oxidoreductase [Leptospiraceae bacterium]|nr:NAD(P)-dependent oxidoreductase [Leptospiraceae bacterium]MDW7975485.1 NAD(P)-dependent oxidoreductase [Leptospiraceae bacterium]
MKTISIIGVGIMGRGMAINLQKKGYRLKLYARNPKKIQDLQNQHTIITDSLKEAVKDSDLTVLCLTEDSVVEKIFFHPDFLGTPQKVIVDTGTTSPELTLRMFEEAKSIGVRFFDAPMTGSKNAALAGQILYMMGGTKEDYEAGKDLFETCGRKTIFCGPVSYGQRAKIALNLVQAGVYQILIEGFFLAKKQGVDFEVFYEILQNSAVNSPILEAKMSLAKQKNFEPHFSLKNMNKDVNHAIQQAIKHQVALPLSMGLKSIYNAGMNEGYGEEDFASLVKIMEKLNTMEL